MLRSLTLILLFTFATDTLHAQRMVWSSILKDIDKRYPEVEQIDVDSLATWLDTPQATPLILDVREQHEYERSHIAGARQVTPGTTNFQFLNEIPRDTPIVAYCSVGYRSSELASALQEAGFTRVYNLEKSIFGWANAGYPVVQGNQPTDKVHPYNKLWGRLLDKKYH